MFIKNVENPVFYRKYEKPCEPDRSMEEIRVKRLKRILPLLPETNKAEQINPDATESTFSKPKLIIIKRLGRT
jgi:hypothetical protein